MWTRISTEISIQINSAFILLMLAIFCAHSDAARVSVGASGDLRFGSNTVTFQGDLSVQGVSVLDTLTSLDTTLVQADLYNLYRLNALRIQQIGTPYNLTAAAVFTDSSSGRTYMAATQAPSGVSLFRWNNSSLSFETPPTYSVSGLSGCTLAKSLKVIQTNALETYLLIACTGTSTVATYKFNPPVETLVTIGFAANAPPKLYGLAVGVNDATAVQHSSGTIFYTQMTGAGSANNIYRTVSNSETIAWTGVNNAATASTFFTIGSTLYGAIGYSDDNITQIVSTSDGLSFTNHHTISTYQVADIDTFVSGNNTYMLVTESVPKNKLFANSTLLVSTSEVFKWNGTGFSKLSGDVIVQNPANSRIFTFQGNTFLVVSNAYHTSSDVAAQLFRWNKVTEEFTLICSLTNVSQNYWWEAFTEGGKSYLVLNTTTKTFVYKLNLN